MEQEISRVLGDYESGRMTRRQLVACLGSLAVLGAAGRVASAGEASSTFEGVGLNHIALRVTDVKRSRDFYVKHLGLTVNRQSESSCFLNCGENFVALFRGDRGEMDHYCYSVKNFDVKLAEDKLRAAGFQPEVPRGTGRIYFPDPDGLTVQLSARSHRP